MLICMRTTIRLPDELYREVRVTAAQSGETVTSFIEDALRAALARHGSEARPAERYRVRPTGEGGLQPGIDLADGAALLDLMESA